MNDSRTKKINAIALEVMRATNVEKEDFNKTIKLLQELQIAISEAQFTAKAS